jgi:purine nucleosidase
MEDRPVIMDCDPGIDDALALLVAAASPQLRLLGVTCVAGNVPVALTAPNARRILDLAGFASVPVYAGCARALARPDMRSDGVHGSNGLGGVVLPGDGRPEAMHATDYLADALLRAPTDTITVIAVGPLTNLAMVEIKHPGTLRRARELLVMGGAAFRPGNVTPHAEFNFHSDALAAHVVLEAGARLTLFGLDVTEQAVMSPGWIASLPALGSRCAQAAHAMLTGDATRELLLHDACPVAFANDPSLFEGDDHALRVDWRDESTEGRLHAMPATPGARAVGRLITRVDGERMMELVRQRLARLP